MSESNTASSVSEESSNRGDSRRLGVGATIIALAEKIVLPVVIALMAFFGKQASDRITNTQIQISREQSAAQIQLAKKQLQIAQAEVDRQKVEAESTRELKYIELFYRDLQSDDPKRQQATVSLLYAMQPRVAQAIARAVAVSPGTSPNVRLQIARLLTDIDRFGPLINYRVVIYYAKEELASAQKIAAGMSRLNFPKDAVELRPEPPNFLDDATKFGYHIRYDEVYEIEPANYLLKNLADCLPGIVFQRVTVTEQRTDYVLTVFLFKKSI